MRRWDRGGSEASSRSTRGAEVIVDGDKNDKDKEDEVEGEGKSESQAPERRKTLGRSSHRLVRRHMRPRTSPGTSY